MRERLMETVIWPSDDSNSEVIGWRMLSSVVTPQHLLCQYASRFLGLFEFLVWFTCNSERAMCDYIWGKKQYPFVLGKLSQSSLTLTPLTLPLIWFWVFSAFDLSCKVVCLEDKLRLVQIRTLGLVPTPKRFWAKITLISTVLTQHKKFMAKTSIFAALPLTNFEAPSLLFHKRIRFKNTSIIGFNKTHFLRQTISTARRIGSVSCSSVTDEASCSKDGPVGENGYSEELQVRTL